MKYFDPMKETPEGELLSMLKSIEESLGIKKYQVEPSGKSTVPSFMEVSGSEKIRAHGFGTNQTIPNMTDGKSRSPISEVYKMPAVSQTGYDTKSSSLHMHHNDGGTGGSMYRDKIEESMMSIKKGASVGQLGIIDEIVGLIEQVYTHL
tara:strand:+ start:233 stop:679 length:447 start_codon:yes stop_codon:yes gene_type:complete